MRNGVFIWKPPFSARIGRFFVCTLAHTIGIDKTFFKSKSTGSWLPGVNASHICYIVTVDRCIRNEDAATVKIEKRYSDFYNLYCGLYDSILEVFAEGMSNPFPDDRFSTWIWGLTEEKTNKRRVQLDAWLRELLITPEIMTNYNCFCLIQDFLASD